MNNLDTRWIQRFNHFINAFSQLEQAVDLSLQRTLSDLEKQGLIQAFEYAHELAWKTLKDFLEDRGNISLFGSKDTIREAFKSGLISEGQLWMDMIQSRNLTSHTYNKETALEVIESITTSYYGLFLTLKTKMESLKANV